MKLILLILFCPLVFIPANAQVGIGNTDPDQSSILDISATDKGILIPRVSLDNVSITQLDGINTAASGLLIWNTNLTTAGGSGIGFYYFNGVLWVALGGSSATDLDWYEQGTTNAPNAITDNIFTNGAVGINTFATGSRQLNVAAGNFASEAGYFSNVSATAGTKTGLYTSVSSNTNASKYGLYNSLGSIDNSGVLYGTYNRLFGANNEVRYGLYNDFSGSGAGNNYGVYSNMNPSAMGDIWGAFNNITNDQAGDKIGVENRLAGSGGRKYGTLNEITANGTLSSYGTLNRISGTGSGFMYGAYNEINGAGTGTHIASYNAAASSSNDNLHGSYNSINGSGSGAHYGSYNLLSGTSPGLQYGTYNDINVAGIGIHYGTRTLISGMANGEKHGSSVQIGNTGNGVHFGSRNNLTGTGTGEKYGSHNSIETTAGGTHFGVYSDVLKQDSFAGYFRGNVAIGTTPAINPTPDYYLLPPSRGTVNQIMQSDGFGVTSWVDNPAVVTAENGLSTTSSVVRLGGTLNQNSAIDQANFSLDFNLSGTGDFNVQDNGTTHFQVRDNGNTYFGGEAVVTINDDIAGNRVARLFNIFDEEGALYLYKNGMPQHRLDAGFTTVFNEQGDDINFRIESDTNPLAFGVDAGENVMFAGTDTVSLTNNGATVNGVTVEYVASFYRNDHTNGTAVQMGSTEYITDFGNLIWGPYGSWAPYSDNTFDLGTSTFRWDDVYATAGVVNTSDIRLKKNIKNLSYGLAEVMKLEPISYQWKNSRDPAEVKIGFSAQQLLTVLPEVVKTHDFVYPDEKGPGELQENENLGVYYSDIIPVLTKAIQEQQLLIEKLNGRIETLEKKNSKL